MSHCEPDSISASSAYKLHLLALPFHSLDTIFDLCACLTILLYFHLVLVQMAEYAPIKTSPSLVTSTAESNESRVLSDDDLIEVEDFASFKCYTPKEVESLFVTFNQIKQVYSLDGDVEAHFYAPTSLYPMKPDDFVGICPMRISPFCHQTHR